MQDFKCQINTELFCSSLVKYDAKKENKAECSHVSDNNFSDFSSVVI